MVICIIHHGSALKCKDIWSVQVKLEMVLCHWLSCFEEGIQQYRTFGKMSAVLCIKQSHNFCERTIASADNVCCKGERTIICELNYGWFLRQIQIFNEQNETEED